MRDPAALHYTKDHEWLAGPDDGIVTIGVTDYAAGQLGDVVYVDLPDPGRTVAAGESAAEVETTKSVSDIFAPVAGEIVATNAALDAAPETINTDPFGDGWIFTVRIDGALPDDLLDEAAYRRLVAEEGE